MQHRFKRSLLFPFCPALLLLTFSGSVVQIRLQPVVEQNVVSYTTVIDVPNREMKLKPGLTANVTVEIARNNDVLRVPNAALRFRPTTELFAALGQTAPAPVEPGGAPVATAGGDRQTAQAPERPLQPPVDLHPERREGAGRAPVWVLREARLEPVSVRLGITDGASTAILGGDLHEGDQIVTGVTTTSATAPQTTASPLLPGRGRTSGARQTAPATPGGPR